MRRDTRAEKLGELNDLRRSMDSRDRNRLDRMLRHVEFDQWGSEDDMDLQEFESRYL